METKQALENLYQAARQLSLPAETHEVIRISYETVLLAITPNKNQTTPDSKQESQP